MLFSKRIGAEDRPVYALFRFGIILGIQVLTFVGGVCGETLQQKHPDSFAEITQTTSTDGITLQFTLPELTISEVIRDNIRYQEVHYADCRFTNEQGNPKVPVTRLMLGIPAAATIEAVDVSAASAETRTGVRLVPVPIFDVHASGFRDPSHRDSQHSASQRWSESGSAYLKENGTFAGNRSYPGQPLARIVREGYIRSQRVIALALYPVQYLPNTRQLRLYSRFTVNIRFAYTKQGGPLTAQGSGSQTFPDQGITIPESEAFERAFSHQLLNAEQAARFRAPRPLVPAAPTLVPNGGDGTRYKLFIQETGIYAVTAASLQNDWGVDLIGTHPTRLRLTQGNRDVPIYISGAADGSLDPNDAIFFLGHKSKNRYSRWNVYWLTVDSSGRIPTRVPQINASPTDQTATQVPTFRSKVDFEEDHLTSNLEFVHTETVSPGDKHGWFDALDFWYWDGIKNGGDAAEMRLEFPLYDVAKSFDPPRISVDLQGGTPVSHEILVAINGVRIDFAEWEQQDTLTIGRTLRTWDTLKDSVNGEQNVLSLARVDSNVDDDTTRYPYHVYLNRFSVEYTRLFRAVADELWFRSPTTDTTPQNQLPGGRKLQYKIEAFRDPGIHIFETDGTHLTARMQGVNVESDAARSKSYNALFQVLDTRNTQFIAVSNTAVRQPDRIEVVAPTDLATAVHGADYLIVTHPNFLPAAQRLAAWRTTPGGGGYRTKVVTTDDIYNTFSDGGVSSKAIKAFLKHAYQSWTPPAPTYVVLFGDGTFDFRGIDTDIYAEPPELTGYIPTHYIRTDSFGRTAADHWYATVSGHDEFTDFYIGRLSIENINQADAVVDKIINYEQTPPNGDWRRRIISVADDEVSNSGDFIFKKSLDEIAKDHTRLGYETVEVFLEDVIDQVEAHPADYPGLLPQRVAKDKIIDALGEGAVLAQYAGHGGRIVWAHEAIFDNASVDQVEETTKIPFMLVLSCYNGYFDKPGEPSMAEKLLRKERGGIIGMLSATRLTYGSGNDALNRIIFDMLFKRNVRQLGPLSFDSKVELLMTEGTGQIDIMMEYTLFGDPALQIAIANGEIQPTIETKTVAPGDTLRIASGHVKTATYDAATRTKRFVTDTTFNGSLTVKALFPGKTAIAQGVAGPVRYYTGDVVLIKTLTVNRGAYPAVTFSVPKNIASGDAHVEYYAQSDATVAVGGDGFTVNIPKILDIKPELVGEDKFRISVQVSDEKEELFLVLLEWRNPQNREWENVRLVPADPPPQSPKTGEGWWTVPEPLNAPTDGSAIRYNLQVTDIDNNTVTSDRLQYYPYVYPNLTIVEVDRTNRIGYGYNSKTEQWYLSADVQVEGESIETPIEVAFFSGNPDVDDDTLVDDDVNLLGTTRIRPNDWVQRTPLADSDTGKDVYEPDPLNTLPIATATLNLKDPLSLGTYDIFVYIDVTGKESGLQTADQPGNVLENDEEDNISYRRLSVDMGVAKTASSGQITSLDRNCVITVPPGSFQETAVLAVRSLDEREFTAVGKSSTDTTAKPLPNGMSNRAPLPGATAHGYEIVVGDQLSAVRTENLLTESQGSLIDNNIKLASPVAIDLNFDLSALRAQLTRELLGGMESEETPLEEEPNNLGVADTIDTALASRARELGIYIFNSTLGSWTRLPSQQLADATGALQHRMHVTNVSEENIGDSALRDVRIQPEGTRTGKYVLFFTGPQTYRLFLAPSVDDTREIGALEVISSVEQLANFSTDFPGFKHGFSLNVEFNFEKSLAFGDVLTFNITSLTQSVEVETDLDSPQQEQRWYASGFRDDNQGTGTVSYIELPPDTAMPEDRWVIFFLTDTEFQVEGERTGILRSQTDGNQPLRGTVEEPFFYKPYGLRFQLTQGERSFAPGDRFRFQTRPVGTIRGTTDQLGPITLLYTDDAVPPDIQLTIGNQQHFISGDATDSEPLIGATLTDPSGLDYLTRPLLLEIGDAFGEYERINPEAYQVTHHPGSNQLVVTYPSPELEPREYEVRLTASDVHGNTDTKQITFRVHDALQLLSFLNYPNPFPRKTTLTCELTAPADSLVVKIYTLSGRLIRELSLPATPGFLMVEWDGRDADGVEVANGVYYAKLRVRRDGEKDITEILKMMKLR